jgi:hypothetical protein
MPSKKKNAPKPKAKPKAKKPTVKPKNKPTTAPATPEVPPATPEAAPTFTVYEPEAKALTVDDAMATGPEPGIEPTYDLTISGKAMEDEKVENLTLKAALEYYFKAMRRHPWTGTLRTFEASYQGINSDGQALYNVTYGHKPGPCAPPSLSETLTSITAFAAMDRLDRIMRLESSACGGPIRNVQIRSRT